MSIRILALDTTTEACSVALMLDNDFLLERFILAPRQHTQHILPMIDSILNEASISLKDLNVLAFGQGPGSFTGIRIGLGIAQGLALGANLPLIGISTLAALAEGAWRQTGISQVLTAINARMGEIYWAPYQRQNNIWLDEKFEKITTPSELALISAQFTGCWATAGTGWQTYPTLIQHEKLELINGQTLLPMARDILQLARYCYYQVGGKPVEHAKVMYLYDETIWKNPIVNKLKNQST